MYNRRYEKLFLMLRQEKTGYALGKRQLWGSCVMEIKNGTGRLHVTVQGLRPLMRGGYAVYVMAAEESLYCGTIYPDAMEGHGELKWEFSPDAVGSGKKAEDFHTLVVLADAGKDGNISAPLTAFFGEKRNWKKTFRPTLEQMVPQEEIRLQAAESLAPPRAIFYPASKQEKSVSEAKTPKTQKIQIEMKKSIETTKAPEAKPLHQQIAEEQKEESYHGSFRGLLAKFRQELEELEETGILTAEETAQIRRIGAEEMPMPVQESTVRQEPIEENVEEPPTDAKPQKDYFANHQELEPFRDGQAWKYLSLEEMVLLSQIPLKWQKEFFFLLPYRRYRHLILRQEEGGFWLGLPGFYRKEEEQDARRFGFGEFRSVEDDWGYWLSFLPEEKQ